MTMQTVQRSELARELMPLVNDVATQIARRVPMHVGLDDLVAAGALGLAGALTRFDPERAETFRGYAESRIRGAIMDELRHRDIMSRDARIESKKLQRSVEQLCAARGREVADEEIADHLGLDLEAYWALQLRLKSARMVSAEQLELLDEAANPYEQACETQSRQLLADCIRALPERQALVLWLYYYEELPLREIAAMLGVTPSRVCQIRSEAVESLRREVEGEQAAAIAA
ncbi:MAG: FliA/WhiG family RNA polymerase sigma factor [Proteobacteria bacterium]|nr:FliA/WhiG family RNA polymerase sigma factor [Pseudomonadota bacterium]